MSARSSLATATLRLRRNLAADLDSASVAQHLSAALDEVAGEPHAERWQMRLGCVAMGAVSTAGRSDLVEELLEGAAAPLAAGPGGQRVYNAALRAIAQSGTPGQAERAVALVEAMGPAGVSRSGWTMQQVFTAAAGDPAGTNEPVQLLLGQLKAGVRPSVGALNAMLAATPPAASAAATGPAAVSTSASRSAPEAGSEPRSPFPMLLGVVDICGLAANGGTVLALLRHAQSPAQVARVQALVDKLHPAKREALRPHLLEARARVDRAALITELASGLRRREVPPPPPLVRRALLLESVAEGEMRTSLSLLQSWWLHGAAADERTARRVLHAAGETAHAGAPGGLELLRALRGAMFDAGSGDGGGGGGGAQRAVLTPSRAQRSGGRRSERAAVEAVRTLARAEWRAGLSSPLAAQEEALARLRAAGLSPTPRLAATCVYSLRPPSLTSRASALGALFSRGSGLSSRQVHARLGLRMAARPRAAHPCEQAGARVAAAHFGCVGRGAAQGRDAIPRAVRRGAHARTPRARGGRAASDARGGRAAHAAHPRRAAAHGGPRAA